MEVATGVATSEPRNDLRVRLDILLSHVCDFKGFLIRRAMEGSMLGM